MDEKTAQQLVDIINRLRDAEWQIAMILDGFGYLVDEDTTNGKAILERIG